jgi:hypothetical protein
MRRIDPPKSKVKSEEEDDHLPQWETPSTVPKVDWETSISTLKRTVATLSEPPESAIFKSSKFPPSLLHIEADLKTNKAFKDEVLRTDAAGACGLAFVRCGEIAHATLGKTSKLVTAIKTAVADDSPQDVASLKEVLRVSLEELNTVKREVERVSLVGSKIAAGVYNQGIREQRRLVCNATAAKCVKSTLEVLKPSLTHLFDDEDSRIDKALEAARFSPGHQPYRPKAPFYRPDSQGARGRKSKPYYPGPRQQKKSSYNPRSTGKGPGPASKKGEGQQKK